MNWSFDNSAFRDFIREGEGVYDSFGQYRKVNTVRVTIPGVGTYEVDLTDDELLKLKVQIDETQQKRRFERQRKQQEQDRERARRERERARQRAQEQARKMQQDWDFINEAFRKLHQDWGQFTFPDGNGGTRTSPLQRLAKLAKVEWPTELSKEKLYRKAQRHCHPDTGGSHDLWLELDELRRTLHIN